ncbi:hypothetical protein GTP45_11745 [Pseudoduganella sp. FT55W]|uniref:Uncharacterized protein n=1 Tax=Duganella rivi TaxID=2666083 RepID=A0A7X4GPY6_9BURK|nr:hypothetical protein [Duganella rivi]MYM67500.1 hypothetical protein [Duganella rivi]
MTKITRKNWINWVAAALILATLLGGFFSALINKGLESSEAAGWMQAIGTVAAIVGAALGIAWQINDNAQRASVAAQAETDRQISALRFEVNNLLKALHSELSAFKTSVDRIRKRMDENEALKSHGMFAMVYPDMTPKFWVYSGCTSKLGLIQRDQLRTDIVRLYAELGTTFATLNLNSFHASRLHDGTSETDQSKIAMQRMAPLLTQQIQQLQSELDRVCQEIIQDVG